MTRPLLIHVTTVPSSLLGFFRGQIPFMKRMGFEVIGVCSPGLALGEIETEHGIAVHPVRMSRSITPLADLAALLKLVRLFRRLRPDVVHSHTPKAGLLGSIAALLAGVPVRLYTMRGFRWETAKGLKQRLLILSEKMACLCAHRVLCNSHSLMQVALSSRIVAKTKAAVLGSASGNGVNVERFRPDSPAAGSRVRQEMGLPEDAVVVGFVGRIVRDKGIVELASAWSGVRQSFVHAHLVLVGPLEQEDPVPEEVFDGLRGDPRVHFTGRVPDAVPYYAAMDVLVLPTYREGFPNVILEAAAMEIPAVATKVTGCVDAVVDGVTGILVPAKDADALAGAVIELFRDPETRRQMGKAARERVVRDFQPERIWRELLEVYREMLEAAPGPKPHGEGLRVTGNWYRRGGKRVLDSIASGAAVLILCPVMALIAVAVRLAMGTPVLYRQPRPGLNERMFTFYKFRTMTGERDAEGNLLPDERRLTWLGRFLRRTSLDELPQLWNVLKGDMSLVGPRPLLPEYLPRYTREQARRHLVRPGITGLAQINGRQEISFSARIHFDVWYVDHRSLKLDLEILLKTALVVLRGRGVKSGQDVSEVDDLDLVPTNRQ